MYAIINRQTRRVDFSETVKPADGAYNPELFEVIETEQELFGLELPPLSQSELLKQERAKLDKWWDGEFQATAQLPRAWAYIIKYLLSNNWDASQPELMEALQHPAIAEFRAYKEAGVTEIEVAPGVSLPVTSPDELVQVWKALAGQWLYPMFGALEHEYRAKSLELESKFAL